MEHFMNYKAEHNKYMEFDMRRLIEDASSAVVLCGFVCVIITWSSAFAG